MNGGPWALRARRGITVNLDDSSEVAEVPYDRCLLTRPVLSAHNSPFHSSTRFVGRAGCSHRRVSRGATQLDGKPSRPPAAPQGCVTDGRVGIRQVQLEGTLCFFRTYPEGGFTHLPSTKAKFSSSNRSELRDTVQS